MAPVQTPVTRSPAYRLGGAVLAMAAATILVALGFEHIGGYVPCPLCLQQRYAYYAGMPLAFGGLVLLAAEQRRAAALVFLLVGLAFLANAGLGVYHAGAEWKYWPGPQSCGGALAPLGGSGGGGVLSSLPGTRVVRCDEAPWRFSGLSFAGWNIVLSTSLFFASLQAAFAAARRES